MTLSSPRCSHQEVKVQAMSVKKLVLCTVVLVGLSALDMLAAATRIPPAMRDRDLLRTTDRPQFVYVTKELTDGVVFKRTLNGTEEKPLRWRRVLGIEYREMRGESLWKVGQDAIKSGNYIEAAQRFQALATGERLWQKAYGFLWAGKAWEAAGAYDRAADAYGQFVANEDLQDHRWFLDALYFNGVSSGRAGNNEAAKNIMDTLSELAVVLKKESRAQGNRANARATAIKASLLIADGKAREAVSMAKKIIWSAEDEDTRFHWGNFWAGYLRDKGQFKDAANEYKRLLSQVTASNQRAILSLGLGVCLAEDGKLEQAQFELLKLDALPYGSPEERLEAAYWAGRVKWELAQKLKDSDKEKRQQFGLSEEKEARRMLKAAAASTVGGKFKDLAVAYLETLPPDPEEEAAAAAAAEEAAAEGEAAAEDPAAE